ncbi:DUF4365 domain-containing protein [Paradevosia shaoguanensis]|uniref:DUF4365 domain-containing protein n=1 Tax=Paradevosia shaoguanensis TaxID=1335043 RepID=UPI0019341BFF|nr:DUF4365 domain-containing protein [Paradevosia shaoguanensis]
MKLLDGDALLHQTDVESALSIAYVYAIAAHAGYNCSEAPQPDRDSIDLQIWAGGQMRPKLDIQLKSTVNLKGSEVHFSYPVKLKNYEDLRVATQTPRILVVLDLPSEPEKWLTASSEQLVIQRCAYWVSLRDAEPTENRATVSVPIPRQNVFDVPALRRLMEMSRLGKIE